MLCVCVCVCFSFYSFPLFLRCLSTPNAGARECESERERATQNANNCNRSWRRAAKSHKMPLPFVHIPRDILIHIQRGGLPDWLTTQRNPARAQAHARAQLRVLYSTVYCGYHRPSELLGPSSVRLSIPVLYAETTVIDVINLEIYESVCPSVWPGFLGFNSIVVAGGGAGRRSAP